MEEASDPLAIIRAKECWESQFDVTIDVLESSSPLSPLTHIFPEAEKCQELACWVGGCCQATY